MLQWGEACSNRNHSGPRLLHRGSGPRHLCIQTYIHTSIHPSIHPSILPYIHTSIHPYIHACIHTCVYVCIYIYIHITRSTGYILDEDLEGSSPQIFCKVLSDYLPRPFLSEVRTSLVAIAVENGER